MSDASSIKCQPLPDCMMPDGADPCAGFRYEADRRNALGKTVGRYADRIHDLEQALGLIGDKLDALLGKYEMPRFMPIGWGETDFERIADYVEPMRREIELLREQAHEATIDRRADAADAEGK